MIVNENSLTLKPGTNSTRLVTGVSVKISKEKSEVERYRDALEKMEA